MIRHARRHRRGRLERPVDVRCQLGTIQVEVDSRISYVVVPQGGIRITPVAHPGLLDDRSYQGEADIPRGTYHQVKVSSSGESWNFSSNRVDRPGRGGELETRRARHLPGGGLRSCLDATADARRENCDHRISRIAAARRCWAHHWPCARPSEDVRHSAYVPDRRQRAVRSDLAALRSSLVVTRLGRR
jgi:hypothetical protein